MSIHLPLLFEDKLKGHDLEKGFVYSALSTFSRWFEASGTPPFFRDYTDHGEKHLTSVLATSASLIPTDATETFSAADVTVYVLSTLLHDSALHLAEPGFYELIKGSANDHRINDLDTDSWPSLWNAFLFSARRWTNEKLVDVFGVTFLKEKLSVSDPFTRWGNLTQADYKLIGEFIRRNHPRLAHEFAVYGIPGPQTNAIKLPEGLPREWADLAGLVARSHGLPLRSCLDYLSKRYQTRDYQGIHTVYLMALLRLADYLQIEASRAPDIVFKFRVIPSRTSEIEWRAHAAVRNITPEHEDPESVDVRVEPSDVETFLRVRSWLDGIQSELDMSWAVLGEVYGRYPTLRKLGLCYRRVRSNLDNVGVFAKSVSYLPRRIRAEVARAELLSLLIRPLYGDDPSYGVRELMQNAVDAVREREYFQQQNPEYNGAKFRNQSADILINLTNFDGVRGFAFMEFSDKGIGMTESVITDYFLTAGASYRHSDHWQRIFERSDLPNDPSRPRSQVIRTGRFGVGALAAFLLSDEIEVETRHIASTEGFKFRMALTQEAVQIERTNNIPVGTMIRVKVTKDVYNALTSSSETTSKPKYWDWYKLNHPVVHRIFNGKLRSQESSIDLSCWHVAPTSTALTVHWSLSDENAPALSCNGIHVTNSSKLPQISAEHCGALTSPRIFVKTPKLHVTDPDGHLALGLTRKELVSDQFGFEREVFQSIMSDFFARFLIAMPEQFDAKAISEIRSTSPFVREHSYSDLDILLANNGYCLPFDGAITSSTVKFQKLLWLRQPTVVELGHIQRPEDWDGIVIEGGLVLQRLGPERGDRLTHVIKSLSSSKNATFEISHARFLDNETQKPRKKQLQRQKSSTDNKDSNETPQSFLDGYLAKEFDWLTEKSYGGPGGEKMKTRWFVESREMTPSSFPFEAFKPSPKGNVCITPFIAEFQLRVPWEETILNSGIVGEWWNLLFGKSWIPWKYEDRRAAFPQAFEQLAPYIAYYQSK
jgi:molecular chaperone HtpG